MGKAKLLYAIVLLLAIGVSCAKHPETKEELISKFEKILKNNDGEEWLKLYCLDGTLPAKQEMLRLTHLTKNKSDSRRSKAMKNLECNLEDAGEEIIKEKLTQGKVPSIKPLYLLRCDVKSEKNGQKVKAGMSTYVGRKDGKLFFVVWTSNKKEVEPENDPQWVYVYHRQAVNMLKDGNFNGYEEMLLKSIGHSEKTLGRNHRLTIKMIDNLAKGYANESIHEKSIALYEDMIKRIKVSVRLSKKEKATILCRRLKEYINVLNATDARQRTSEIEALKEYNCELKNEVSEKLKFMIDNALSNQDVIPAQDYLKLVAEAPNEEISDYLRNIFISGEPLGKYSEILSLASKTDIEKEYTTYRFKPPVRKQEIAGDYWYSLWINVDTSKEKVVGKGHNGTWR